MGLGPFKKTTFDSFTKVAFEDDLKTALSKVFADQTSTGGTPVLTGTPQEQLVSAIDDANKAYEAGQAALAKGDFAAYGKAQSQLEEALRRITTASAQVGQG